MISNRVRRSPKPVRILLMVTGILLLLVALGFWIQLLWNATIATMFDLSPITYWQAFGLFVLAKLFFSVGPFGRRGKYRHRKHAHGKHSGEAGDGSDSDEEATFQKEALESEGGSDSDRESSFKKYWQEEGKQAYASFLENQKDGQGNEPEK